MTEKKKTWLGTDRMTAFERAVVFRVARGYFFAMAVGAVLLFVAGVIMGAKGLVKTEVPHPPASPAPAPRKPLSYADVLAEAQRAAQQNTPQAVIGTPGSSGSAGSDKSDSGLQAASKALHAVFPDPPYAWTDEVEQTCVAPTSFGCLQTGTRVKRHGIVPVIDAALHDVDPDEIVDYVNLLAQVLKDAPVEKRLELIPVVIRAEIRARKEQKRLEQNYRESQKELEEKYQQALDASTAQQQQWRAWGIYGVGAGFALLIVVSLFLAFLSMERHTRALEQLVSTGWQPPHRAVPEVEQWDDAR